MEMLIKKRSNYTDSNLNQKTSLMKTSIKFSKVLVTVCVTILLSVTLTPEVNGQDTTESVPEISMVEVNGFDMRVQTAGLQNRQADEPVVIFENGGLAPLEAWGQLVARVADFAPVVAYDRSTTGKSEWDGELGTPSHVTENLRALLSTLGVDPPYILVGWSWGGNLIRYHTGRHPDDIEGLVYIDPPNLSFSETMNVLESIGYGEDEYTAITESMEEMMKNLPESAQAGVMPILDFYKNRQEPEVDTILEVPTSVILAGRYSPPYPEGTLPDPEKFFEASFNNKVEKIGEWALSVPEGLLIVNRNSGHAVQIEQPSMVVEAIRSVVFPSLELRLMKALKNGGDIESLTHTYRSVKKRYPPEMFKEEILNSLGYDLLRRNQIQEAVAVFELNVEEYPQAFNPYDSLGDGFMAAGETEKALESYRKSSELNPNSPSAAKLEQLEKQN